MPHFSNKQPDFVITQGNKTYNVHKDLPGPQPTSSHLSISVNQDHGKTNTPTDDPEIINLLVHYMSGDTTNGTLPHAPTQKMAATKIRNDSFVDNDDGSKAHGLQGDYTYGFPHTCTKYYGSCKNNVVCPHHTCGKRCSYNCQDFICGRCERERLRASISSSTENSSDEKECAKKSRKSKN